MATNIAIANLALARLGDDATVASLDPPEGSPQAEHCALFLPLARSTLLEMHSWSFATRRALLAPRTEVYGSAWLNVYARPQNCLKVLGILPDGYDRDTAGSLDFELESAEDGTDLILTNEEGATARYICAITDPSKFSPLFTDALVWLLASYIAGPVLKGDAGAAAAKEAFAAFGTMYHQAVNSDVSQGHRKQFRDSAPWTDARGGVLDSAWRNLGPVRS